MGAWFLSFRMVEREPYVNQISNQLVSVVTITRAALTHSDPILRRELLFDLASNEGIRVYVKESTDQVDPPEDRWSRLISNLQQRLGSDTKISGKVNGIESFWVSFKIDEEDEYWLALPRGRFEGPTNWQWLWWATAGFVLSLMGAGFISDYINRPLARLAAAARTFASGKTPSKIPEEGSAEVKDANRSFNQMMSELERNEKERNEILAGISHDLRTPLTRIQLELEMSGLSEEAKSGMESDIRQMDAIVGQFLDYANVSSPNQNDMINMSLLLEEVVEDALRNPIIDIESDIESDLYVQGNTVDFKRIFNNLVSNAERYGRNETNNRVELLLTCKKKDDRIIVEFSDTGPGILEEDREKLLRPFTRKNTARSQANGSGLGLAIVNRIVQRNNGRLTLKDSQDGGLLIEVVLPRVEKAQPEKSTTEKVTSLFNFKSDSKDKNKKNTPSEAKK